MLGLQNSTEFSCSYIGGGWVFAFDNYPIQPRRASIVEGWI